MGAEARGHRLHLGWFARLAIGGGRYAVKADFRDGAQWLRLVDGATMVRKHDVTHGHAHVFHEQTAVLLVGLRRDAERKHDHDRIRRGQ